ncbi:transcription repressor NadR [Tetragenococcus solitarius]|uniref:Transcription repressor NadR n=1 Tax=Tetragenococcus solitarius TaxID=71453 RepID=A0ABN3Y336_9ENTE|nr:transcription repressor NadR [Tetragenococcus solitarius]
MDGLKRRETLLDILQQSVSPISASTLARKFDVSRQIIVGDVALLRASGEEILATAKGYKMAHADKKYTAKIAVQHSKEQTQNELETIVSLGGEIIDVIIEHDLYGEITGNLYIKELSDVKTFMRNYKASKTALLLQLTEGIHLHTIAAADQKTLETIKEALAKQEILYQQ